MSVSGYIQIQTSQFPILNDEEDELVNPNTYGKSFARYLESHLKKRGYVIPFICCEDWGWWVEVSFEAMNDGICCYREHDENSECKFVCAPGLEPGRKWSWRKFRFIDVSNEHDKLVSNLMSIFGEDPNIEYISETDEFPF